MDKIKYLQISNDDEETFEIQNIQHIFLRFERFKKIYFLCTCRHTQIKIMKQTLKSVKSR